MSDIRYTVVFARRPVGAPTREDFAILESALPEPGDGEVLVAARYISIDPYVRTMIDAANPYGAPMELGIAVPGDIAGEVVASNDSRYAIGDWVAGRLGWQTHAVSKAAALRRLDLDLADPPIHLALLGSSGLTGWFGMTEIGRPKAGENVLVSGAAGAVGQVASQVAKVRGARVFGIAGGAAKCVHLTDTLGLDGAIDHRAGGVGEALDRLCSEGFDVYFDNVGGTITDAVMTRLKRHARIVVCGESSQYDVIGREFNPRILGPMMDTRATMTGLLVTDFAEHYETARGELGGLYRRGEIKVPIDIVDGVENAPQALIGMLKGENTGKRLVSVTQPTRMSRISRTRTSNWSKLRPLAD